jgi:hypothetical protein
VRHPGHAERLNRLAHPCCAVELAGGLLVRSVSGPALQADVAAKTLTLTLKPGETAVLGYSFR